MWKKFVSKEKIKKHFENLFSFQLFERCLTKVLNIDLWKCYISYVRDTKGILPSFRLLTFFFSTTKSSRARNEFHLFVNLVPLFFRNKTSSIHSLVLFLLLNIKKIFPLLFSIIMNNKKEMDLTQDKKNTNRLQSKFNSHLFLF